MNENCVDTNVNCICTIGHGNKSFESFACEVKKYNIDYLIDVRSKPYSKYSPQFNREQLSASLKQCGVVYSWWGEVIGGIPPVEWLCYTSDWKVDYNKLSEHPIFLSGIERLINACKGQYKVVIMCSESDPSRCHRSKLIGKVLQERGVEVQHIVRYEKTGGSDDGIRLLSQAQVYGKIIAETQNLFNYNEEPHLTSRKSF